MSELDASSNPMDDRPPTGQASADLPGPSTSAERISGSQSSSDLPGAGNVFPQEEPDRPWPSAIGVADDTPAGWTTALPDLSITRSMEWPQITELAEIDCGAADQHELNRGGLDKLRTEADVVHGSIGTQVGHHADRLTGEDKLRQGELNTISTRLNDATNPDGSKLNWEEMIAATYSAMVERFESMWTPIVLEQEKIAVFPAALGRNDRYDALVVGENEGAGWTAPASVVYSQSRVEDGNYQEGRIHDIGPRGAK